MHPPPVLLRAAALTEEEDHHTIRIYSVWPIADASHDRAWRPVGTQDPINYLINYLKVVEASWWAAAATSPAT